MLIADTSNDKFSVSLIHHLSVLYAGRYTVMINAQWNEHANEDPAHKQVHISMLAPEKVEFVELSAVEGIKLFETALIKHALLMPQMHKPIANLKGAYRCINIDKGLSMWFGYIFTKNGSNRGL
jgi:hypothetical protein